MAKRDGEGGIGGGGGGEGERSTEETERKQLGREYKTEKKKKAELRSCVKVEVDVLGSRP